MPTNKKYYAWAGQNASTGTPNKNTGRMSLFGTNMVFESKKDRDEYVWGFHSDNPSVFCVACRRRELRELSLGSSVAHFEDDLRSVGITYRNEDGNWGTYYE